MANNGYLDTIENLYTTIIEIKPYDNKVIVQKDEDLIKKYGISTESAQTFVKTIVEKFGMESYCERLKAFFDLDQFPETYSLKKYSELEVYTSDFNWYRICVIPNSFNEEGKAEDLFICFQNIVSIKSSEEKHNKMLNAMSNIFDAMFFVDLKTKLLGDISIGSNAQHLRSKGQISDAKEEISLFIAKDVNATYKAEMRSFLNINTLSDRLKENDLITNDYIDGENRWWRCQIICADREAGKCVNAILGFRDISNDKNIADTKNSIISSLTKDYRNIFSISLKTGKVEAFRLDETTLAKFGDSLSVERFDDLADYYINNAVLTEDRPIFENYKSIDSLALTLANSFNEIISYRIKENNEIHYYEIHVSMSPENKDIAIMAIKNVDNEVELKNDAKRGFEAYVTLQKLIKSGMWSQFFDEEGRLYKTYFSDEFRKMLGYSSKEDFPDDETSMIKIVYPADLPRVLEGVSGLLNDTTGNVLFDETYRVVTKDKGIRWYRATGDVTRRSNGRPYSFYGVFLDVTDQIEREKLEGEREAALEEAKAYQDSMNSILGAMNSGRWMIHFTTTGKFSHIEWDEQFKTTLGYGESDELKDVAGFLKLIHPEDFPDVSAAFNEAVNNAKKDYMYTNEFRVRTKAGDYKWYKSVARVPFDEGGIHKTIYGLVLDVDEKKKNEALLEEQYRIVEALSRDYTEIQLLDLAIDQAVIMKKSGVMTEFDEPLVSKFSTEWGKMIDRYSFPEDSFELEEALSAHHILEELSLKNEYTYSYRLNRNGEHFFQAKFINLSGFNNANSHIVAGIRSVDDIIASEKEQKVMLKNALCAAEKANRAKTVFLNSMSHDIRTPMNAIVGFSALASTHIDNKVQVLEYLEKIKLSSNHLLSLINDVLDMSRIESGKVKIDAKKMHIPEVMHEIQSIIQSDISAKRLGLNIDCLDVINEFVICDKLRLNQVLLNLVSNAIKFTPAGGLITVKVIQKNCVVKGKANYEFVVKDTGIGMSQGFMEQIFEPFTREETSTVSGIQGTGLGMAITKNIVDMMNGTIRVSSELGKGTEFVVSLSFDTCEADEEEKSKLKLPDYRVLVVDDDMDSCFSLSKMLTSFGLRAEWTTSGKEALARAKYSVSENDVYSVFFIDWLMPDINGIEIIRRMKKEVGPNAKFIIMSAYDWTDVEDEAYEAGATAILSKPIFRSDLEKVLAKSYEPEKEKADEINEETFKGRRILIVEDNELNSEIAVGILEMVGFETEVACDGNIAVDMVSNSKKGYYDVVLMDIQMPTMNGYEATKCIRELNDENLKNIPIIAMTANAFEEDRKKATEVGMDGYVAKPFDSKVLFATIQSFLK